MIVATKVKLYPNEKQKVLLEKHFGSCRFVYNYFLAKRDEYYLTHKDAEKSSLNYLDTQNMLIELKKQYPWLYEVNSQSLQMSLRFLDNAFKNFFHHNTEHPKFRKKGKNDYFAVPQHVKIEKNRIYFSKF
jgi:putative transposase